MLLPPWFLLYDSILQLRDPPFWDLPWFSCTALLCGPRSTLPAVIIVLRVGFLFSLLLCKDQNDGAPCAENNVPDGVFVGKSLSLSLCLSLWVMLGDLDDRSLKWL